MVITSPSVSSSPSPNNTLTSQTGSAVQQLMDPISGSGSVVPMDTGSNEASNGEACPKASLLCRPNSHPFQDRLVSLDQAVKVGRSVARARPSSNNAIFDCKVLSRNHALIWYDGGKFFLQDTKSSNGTFVNNQRLSKGSEESLPREVCSGDILQFGVDVMENSRKVTHGCIIATLKLFLPDGKEAKASPTIMNSSLSNANSLPVLHDLYQLNQYIQEALAREQLLETKLAVLQRLVGQTGDASSTAWKSLIDEDRLLTRVEILESQLSVYGKSMTEDKLRDECQRLVEEKETYQEIAKETLKRLTDEKVESAKKVSEIQTLLNSTDDEFSLVKELHAKTLDENKDLLKQLTGLSQELEEVKEREEELRASKEAAAEAQENQNAEGNEDTPATDDTSAVTEAEAEAEDQVVTNKDEGETSLMEKSLVATEEEANLAKQPTDTESSHETSPGSEESTEAKALSDCETQTDLEEQAPDNKTGVKDIPQEENLIQNLREQLEKSNSQVEALQATISTLKASSAKQSDKEKSDASSLNLSNASDKSDSSPEDRTKMLQLLKVKEKYEEVNNANEKLKVQLKEVTAEMDTLKGHSQITTIFAIVPLFIIILAIIFAYLPGF